MSVTQYIGARYVPLFADPAEWTSDKAYEPLTIVMHEGNSYTSKQAVPIGIDINNDEFWALTGNYNAQVEAYRREVREYDGRISANAAAIEEETLARETADSDLQESIEAETTAREEADAALQGSIDAEATAREEADTALQGSIEAEAAAREMLESRINNTANNFYIYPLQEGRLRINTENYTGATKPSSWQGQGLCYHDGNVYIACAGNSGTSDIYKHPIGNTTFEKVATINQTDHPSEFIWIPEIEEYWISQGTNIFRYNYNFAHAGNISLPFNNPTMAYDKATHKIYLAPYTEGTVFEIDANTHELTDLGFSIQYNQWKQSMAAHNGMLYVLFSFPSSIIQYSTVDKKEIAKISIPDNHYAPLGETEGIDTNSEGNLYISSYANYRSNSVYLNFVWYLNLKNPNSDPAWTYNNRDIYVTTHTNDSLKANQRPTGLSTAPFPTLDEAMLYLELHKQLNRIIITGDHSMELLESMQSYLQIEGREGDGLTKPKLGRSLINGGAYFYNIEFAPKISVANFILGYRNAPITIHSCSKSGAYSTPTSGYDVQSNYPVNTTVTNNVNFS